jgi:hypothetical protein
LKTPRDLTREQLEQIVEDVQLILWQEYDGKWNHDQEWDSATLEHVAQVFVPYGLGPAQRA